MKVTGSNIAITDSVINKMQILPLGNCEQDGTPTPDYPQDVKVVTGDNQVVVQNKNLALNDNPENPDANYTSSGGGTTEVQYSTEEQGYYVTRHRKRVFANLKAGTYTLSMNLKARSDGTSSYGILIRNILGGGVLATFNIPTNETYERKSVTVTLIENSGLDLTFYDTLYWNDIQLEISSTATSYVPHQEQSITLHLGDIKLNGIGNYIDLPFKDGDTWKIRRKVSKVVYTGASSENWELNQAKQYCTQFIGNTISDAINETEYTQKSYTNYFKFQQGNPTDTTQDGYYWKFQKRLVIVIPNTLASTVADLRTWLSTHNVVFYYRLAEPTEETITDTTLINDLNNLQELLSYDGTTNITVTSEDTNAQMEVEVTYTSESDMNEKLTEIFNSIKSKLYHIIRAL